MKLFCKCNQTERWFEEGHPLTGAQILLCEVQKDPIFRDDDCPKCKLYYWYDPWYENMMYDLKEANRC